MSEVPTKSIDEQLELLTRGCDAVLPEGELRKKLQRSQETGKPLRVKYGIDPTGIDVHLGHTVPLRKLRLFQELGHQAVLIIGNYTALVGDPSGRDQTRARLSQQEVEENARDYITQVSKVIDIDKTEVRPNGDWFSKFSFLDVLSLTSQITMQRMLERDDFTKRLASGTPISLHECLYPLMQARDSVEIQADVELGGSEQLFSLMLARDLQKDAAQDPQICVTLPILRGLDGNRRMGKSLGNYIGVGEPPYDQFAKVMKIPDDLMEEWFTLLTSLPRAELEEQVDPERTHPKAAKKRLGREIVGFYNGEEAAREAQAEWESRVEKGGDPTEIPVVEIASSTLNEGQLPGFKLVASSGLAESNNQARRLIQQGGVTIGEDRTKLSDPNAPIPVRDGLIVRVSKRKVIRVRLV